MTSTLTSNVQRTLDLLLPQIESQSQTLNRPLILGITGLQGAGKSTWATLIVQLLESEHHLRAITVSLDDFYKTHDELVAQREKAPGNRLYRTRGQPGTHDEELARSFFEGVKKDSGEGAGDGDEERTMKIPRFDKSKFRGEGDRAPEEEWPEVKGKVDVIVFEGWCIGFQSLSPHALEAKYHAAITSRHSHHPSTEDTDNTESITTLADHTLPHLHSVNLNLSRYNHSFMGPQHFDFLIHIDTTNLRNVYRWRVQQEQALIEAKGTGMAYEEVVAFVRGYMPAYELYLDGLREGLFAERGRQVRVTLGAERELEGIEVI